MITTNPSIMVAPIPRTLIADDQPDVATALRLLLREAGYQTEAVTSPAAVLEAIQQHNYDLLLMDLNYARDTTSGCSPMVSLKPRTQQATSLVKSACSSC